MQTCQISRKGALPIFIETIQVKIHLQDVKQYVKDFVLPRAREHGQAKVNVRLVVSDTPHCIVDMLDIILLNNIASSVEIDLSICSLDEGDMLAPPGMPWYDSLPQCVTRLEFDLGSTTCMYAAVGSGAMALRLLYTFSLSFSEEWTRDAGVNRHSTRYQRSVSE